MQPEKTKAKLYTRYPLSSVLVSNNSTVLYLLGGVGIALECGSQRRSQLISRLER
jgi:hypothetical protein